MVKKKQSQETETAIVVDEDEIAAAPEEDQTFKDLSDKLSKLRKDKDVIGYIIRNKTSATIDLEKPEKLAEYAIFSSQVLESSQEKRIQWSCNNAQKFGTFGSWRWFRKQEI